MGNKEEQAYLDILRELVESGESKGDRTGTGTRSLFARSLRFDLSKGFPLLTTKKVHFKSVAVETIWFLKGDTNVKYLNDRKVSIWDEWKDENGDLGPVYGKQWRRWEGKNGVIDQIKNVIEEIKKNPNSRRLLVSAWNVEDVPKMALPPCHYSFQFVVNNGKLNLLFNMRSSDFFLGTPFNIVNYSLLLCLVAHQTGLLPGELVYHGADVHLYNNHIEQAKEQISRVPTAFPTLKIKVKRENIEDYEYEDFEIVGYNPQASIKAPVSV